jgi:hypothetical protein
MKALSRCSHEEERFFGFPTFVLQVGSEATYLACLSILRGRVLEPTRIFYGDPKMASNIPSRSSDMASKYDPLYRFLGGIAGRPLSVSFTQIETIL